MINIWHCYQYRMASMQSEVSMTNEFTVRTYDYSMTVVYHPNAPCMDYLPTFGEKWPHSRGNVGKYSLHGASGSWFQHVQRFKALKYRTVILVTFLLSDFMGFPSRNGSNFDFREAILSLEPIHRFTLIYHITIKLNYTINSTCSCWKQRLNQHLVCKQKHTPASWGRFSKLSLPLLSVEGDQGW